MCYINNGDIMKSKIDSFFFVLAYAIKAMFIMFIASSQFLGIAYTLLSFSIYLLLFKKSKSVSTILPIIMIDYIVVFYFTYLNMGLGLDMILISILAFILSNSFVFYLLINDVAIATSSKKLYSVSNDIVDEGIKALENEDYDKALEAFSNAIKEYKRNYLGYMGMCTTLTKMDKKNIKKIKYYKKKCLKYAPRELKESIGKKY